MSTGGQMQKMLSLALLLTHLLVQQIYDTAAAATPVRDARSSHPLVLISLDGFRHDYLSLFSNSTPNLNSLVAGGGAYAAKVKPAYVTKTAANHWTIVTGLHEEVHGVVNNQVFDPVFNETVEMLGGIGADDERWWNGSEPVWLTAESSGLRTGVYQWPGGGVAIGGRLPTYRGPPPRPWPDPAKLQARLEMALGWLAEGNASLAAVYYHEPDLTAHNLGPAAVGPVLTEIDAAIGQFLGQLERRGMRDRVNVIITSDHGMLPVNQSNVIRVAARDHPATRALVQMGIALGLFAWPGRREELQAAMRRATEGRPVQVLLREQLPDRLHYRRHRRIPDLLLLPDKDYLVADTGDRVWKLGIHGADNDWDEMQVPLLATGPGFAKGARIEGARQTDIYGLVCRLIGVPARPNNGTEYPLAGLLASGGGPACRARPAVLHALLLLLLLLLLGVGSAASWA